MRKLLTVILFVVGSTLWATEGTWTYHDDGSYLIEYDSSTSMWAFLYEMIEDCDRLEETQIPVRWGAGQHQIEVEMFSQRTVIRIIDDGYFSIIWLLKS